MKKQFFNMIEIMLALGVIAIGMSSILVLFPVGLNATNSATADNSVPDAALYFAGYLETSIRDQWQRSGTSPRSSTLLNGLPTAKPGEPASIGWTNIPNTPVFYCGTAGLFKYEQSHTVNGASVVDFAAEARVWRESNFIHVPGQAAPVSMTTGSAIIFIEVSYPLTKPYADREKQIYRFDLYDYGA